MKKPIDIEILILQDIDGTIVQHVLINIDVGKMPPSKITEYIKKVGNSLPLCKLLNELNITYSLIGCRPSDEDISYSLNMKYEDDEKLDKTAAEKIIKHLSKFDDAMGIVEK